MSYYQLMMIFSPALTEDEEKQQCLQVEELLKHEKATIHFIDHWGKRKLASTIKKQRQGYYEWLYFELDPGRVAEIDRKLKMSEPILRFLLFQMEKAQIANLQKEIARRSEAAESHEEPKPEAVTTEQVVTEQAAASETAEADATAIQEPGQEG